MSTWKSTWRVLKKNKLNNRKIKVTRNKSLTNSHPQSKKILFTVPQWRDASKSWNEWLFKMLIMPNSTITDITRTRLKTKKNITMDQSFQSGDSPQTKEEERTLPLFAGIQNTKICLQSATVHTNFWKKQQVLFAVTQSKTLLGQNITSQLRAESCVLTSIRSIKLYSLWVFMMAQSWCLISDQRAISLYISQTLELLNIQIQYGRLLGIKNQTLMLDWTSTQFHLMVE